MNNIKIGDVVMHNSIDNLEPIVITNLTERNVFNFMCVDYTEKQFVIKYLPLNIVKNKDYISIEDMNKSKEVVVNDTIFKFYLKKCEDIPNFNFKKIELYQISRSS